jgi:hypothetical protein
MAPLLFMALGTLGAALLWVAIWLSGRTRGRCPQCRLPFSDWFTWGEGGPRFCWPCWHESDYTVVLRERVR